MPAGQPHGLALGRTARVKRRSIKVAFMSGYYFDQSGLLGKFFRNPLDVDDLLAQVGLLLTA